MNVAGVLRGRWRLAHHTLFGAGRKGARRRLPLLAAALTFTLAAMVYGGLAVLFDSLATVGLSLRESGAVLGLVLGASLAGLLVFDVHEGVSALFGDSDLELLRRAPIRPAALLALKLLDALPRTSTMLVVLILPAVLAFATLWPVPAWAWPALPVLFASLWAIPLGLGITLALVLLEALPARRAKEMLGVVWTLVLTALLIANAFLLPRLQSAPEALLERLRTIATQPGPLAAASPAQWMAHAIVAAIEGDGAAFARATLVLAVAALASLGLAAVVAGWRLERAQWKVAASAGRGRARRAARAAAPPGFAWPRSVRALAALLTRDARLFLRDWTVLGDVITAAALWTALPLIGAPLHAFSSPDLARAMLLALTVGLGYEIAARTVPFERRGVVWSRLAPVSSARWIAAKLIGAALLSLPLLALAVLGVGVAIPLPPRVWAETLCTVVPALVLALALGVWTGVRFGDPEWLHPRAMLTLPGRILATVLLLAQAGGWLALASFASVDREHLPTGWSLWAPALIAAAAAALPLRSAARHLARNESIA